ncbi:MAG: hypothetical protein GY801_03740 [bacterium]|nr:hypothetical protein [bacterium]
MNSFQQLSRLVVLFVTLLASSVMAETGQVETGQVEKLLERADFYFTYGWLTSPRHKNAYALYQRVITLDPLNRYATEKIYEISEYYRNRVEEIKKEGNAELAGMHHYRYQKIIEYLLAEVLKQQFDLLNDELRKWQEQRQAGADVEQESIQTLELIVQVLQDMENIYRRFPEDKFKTAAEQLREKIEKYEQLRTQYGEQE